MARYLDPKADLTFNNMKKKGIIVISAVLLFAACDRFAGQHDHPQPQAAFAPDSLWTSTGDAQLDSLLQLEAVAPQDTNLIILYYRIGSRYMHNDLEKAKEYFLKLNNLSEQLDWNEGRYSFAAAYSIILARERLTDTAIVILQHAYELAKRENNASQVAIMNANMGTVYTLKGWYEMALSCYMEALPFLESENNPQKLLILYVQISQLYKNINDLEKAIEYGEKALALNREDEFTLEILGSIYTKKNQFETANDYYREALQLCELHNNIYLTGLIYYHLADNALIVFDLDLAEQYVYKSLEISEQFNCSDCCAIFMILSRIELMKGNFDQSEEYVNKALEMATGLESLEVKRFCYIILSELAIARRKYRENMQYRFETDLIEAELTKEKALRTSEEMNAKFETAKKDFEIERQQHVISRQNIQRWLLAAGIAVCVVFLSLLYYMLRLRIRRNRALAERSDALSERNNALSEMNATKDKFFSIISHDLRNPVIAQRDALQLLVQNSRLWDVDTLTVYYRELLLSADVQVELIYNLLGWAQLQTGRITYNPSTFNLAHRLRSDIALIRNMADQKGVTFTASIPDDANITGDAAMLSVVVRNLLTNAVKYTPAAGTVTLDVTPDNNVTTPGMPFEAATRYTVTVSDTGVGMSASQIDKLFRLDSVRSRKGTAGEQGSGLGLIVCRELLEKHGSELHVESEEEKGSRFWFDV